LSIERESYHRSAAAHSARHAGGAFRDGARVKTHSFAFACACAVTSIACRGGDSAGISHAPEAAPAASLPAPPPLEPPRHARLEHVAVPGDLSAMVVRRTDERTTPMLFVHGMCVHPGGYVESFRETAADHGDLVALYGDVPCSKDGMMRRWSYDFAAIDRRVVAAFGAAGLGEPRGIVVIGYSQGADIAEKLVARWPVRYARAVLIGSPAVPSPQLLARAKAVALAAGTHDVAYAAMKTDVAALARAGIPAAFFPLPGAFHGQMGEDPEETMREALDFVTEKRGAQKLDDPPSHGAVPSR